MSDGITYPIVDQVIDATGHRSELTRVHKIGSDTVRIRVRHDRAHVDETYAVAEVLNSDRKWTEIAHEPADDWHDKAQSADHVPDLETALHIVADHLYERAAAILTA